MRWRRAYDAIVPDLRAGGCVLVVSHGNTLRALIKHLDRIPDQRIAALNVPTGIPLAYQLGPDMRPVTGARYLSHRPGMTANDRGYGPMGLMSL